MRRLLLLALALTSALPALAQRAVTEDTPLRPVTRTFALTNARVVQAPGRVLEGATVVVRDGLIEAVGADVAAPFDAEVIAADSLTVYAGFIDALGYAGVPKPDDEERPEIENPDEPPRDVAGLTPDRDVRALLDAEDVRIEQLRALGFTAAQVAPRDGFLSGSTALVLLAGDAPEALVLRGDAAQLARFDTAPNVYPATPMAILARLRELMRQAREAADDAEAYQAAPLGRGRAAYDPALAALADAARGEQPLLFLVDDSNEAYRALKLGADAGLDVRLAGLPDATALADRLAAEERPLLLSLVLPDEIDEDADSTVADTTAAATADSTAADPLVTTLGGTLFATDYRTRSYEDLETETAALRQKRRAALARLEASAARLDSLGVPFAFALLDAKPGDVRANLRRVVAAGLGEDAALAALTTDAAALLGLDASLGTVEPGKLANLVVTDGGYFDEDTAVRYVFVDGQKFELEDEEPPEGADPDAVVTATGTWDFTVDTPNGAVSGSFTLDGDADDLDGSITADQMGTVDFDEVTLDGNVLTLRYAAEGMGRITITGIIDGDTYDATAEVAGGDLTIPLEATRRPD